MISRIRHARPCAAHPRLASLGAAKTWMAGTSPAMTARNAASPRSSRHHLFDDLPADRPVRQRSIAPPPAVLLHLFGRGDEAVRHLGKIRIGVVEAENQTAGANPAQRQSFGPQVI